MGQRCKKMRKYSAMQIFVKRDKTMTLEISPFDTIADVKKQISDREGIPPGNMLLTSAGKPLKDHLSIQDYSISKHCTLSLTLTHCPIFCRKKKPSLKNVSLQS